MGASLAKFNDLDILLICGVFGAGKSEFATKHFRNSGRSRISRNEIRKLLHEMTHFNDPWESAKFTEEDDILVKHIERKIMEHYLHNKRKVLVINTFATKKSRQRFTALAKEMKKTIGAIYLNMPLEHCLAHYKSSNPTLPENVLRSMFHKQELLDKAEGFTEILTLHP